MKNNKNAKYPTPVPILDTVSEISKENITNKDVLAVIDFLDQYSANKATFEAYRRETERLLQWTSLIASKSIFELKRPDIQTYIDFCLAPPKAWIATKSAKRFILEGGIKIPNPAWRPFVAKVCKREHKQGELPDKNDYQLSQKAIREIFTILSSFYNYLVLEEKVSVNPVALIKQKSKYLQKQQKQAPVMRL
jgi:site-specific recombinase XerD